MVMLSHKQVLAAAQRGPLRIVRGKLMLGAGLVPSDRIMPDPAYTGPHCGVDGCPTCGKLPHG